MARLTVDSSVVLASPWSISSLPSPLSNPSSATNSWALLQGISHVLVSGRNIWLSLVLNLYPFHLSGRKCVVYIIILRPRSGDFPILIYFSQYVWTFRACKWISHFIPPTCFTKSCFLLVCLWVFVPLNIIIVSADQM